MQTGQPDTTIPPLLPPHPVVRAIAAMARNRVIGRDGTIPWRISDELRWFKKTTLGHTVLMGSRTYASLGRPLPGRRNIVVSRTLEAPQGVEVLRSLDAFDPAALAGPGTDLFIIGGGEIYTRLLPLCQELILSVIPQEVEGDTFFPEFESLFSDYERVLEHPEFEVRRYWRRVPAAKE